MTTRQFSWRGFGRVVNGIVYFVAADLRINDLPMILRQFCWGKLRFDRRGSGTRMDESRKKRLDGILSRLGRHRESLDRDLRLFKRSGLFGSESCVQLHDIPFASQRHLIDWRTPPRKRRCGGTNVQAQ